MRRILTIICALTFSGAALSAQNNADTITVNRNESDTLVIIVKEKQSVDRQAKKEQRLAEKALIVQTSNSLGQTGLYGESAHLTDSVSETDSMSAVVQDSGRN